MGDSSTKSDLKLIRGEPFKSARQRFSFVNLTRKEERAGYEHVARRITEHSDYMDFAEAYADYVVQYEKVNS